MLKFYLGPCGRFKIEQSSMLLFAQNTLDIKFRQLKYFFVMIFLGNVVCWAVLFHIFLMKNSVDGVPGYLVAIVAAGLFCVEIGVIKFIVEIKSCVHKIEIKTEDDQVWKCKHINVNGKTVENTYAAVHRIAFSISPIGIKIFSSCAIAGKGLEKGICEIILPVDSADNDNTIDILSVLHDKDIDLKDCAARKVTIWGFVV